MTTIDLTGHRYKRLLVDGFSHRNDKSKGYWHCTCDCGTKKVIAADALRSGGTVSCGCYSNAVSLPKAHEQQRVIRECKNYFKPKDIAEPEEIDRHTMEEEVYPPGFAHHW